MHDQSNHGSKSADQLIKGILNEIRDKHKVALWTSFKGESKFNTKSLMATNVSIPRYDPKFDKNHVGALKFRFTDLNFYSDFTNSDGTPDKEEMEVVKNHVVRGYLDLTLKDLERSAMLGLQTIGVKPMIHNPLMEVVDTSGGVIVWRPYDEHILWVIQPNSSTFKPFVMVFNPKKKGVKGYGDILERIVLDVKDRMVEDEDDNDEWATL